MNYQNTYRLDDWNCSIVEWDMKAANISICAEYELLPPDRIEKILAMPKSKRERTIGLIGQKDRVFQKTLDQKFDEVVKIFMEQNELDMEWDILSIRRDALFVINKEIKCPTIGSHILFRPKGVYSHHLYLKPYDIYISSDTIDVKGINDDLLPLHQDGMLLLFRTLAECQSQKDPKKQVNEVLSQFVLDYKKRELDYSFYREFNANSKYRVQLFDREVLMDNVNTPDMLEKVNISYNYESIILPLVRLLR